MATKKKISTDIINFYELNDVKKHSTQTDNPNFD